MTFRLSKTFHGVGIGPLSKILAVKQMPIITSKDAVKNAFVDEVYFPISKF